MAAIMSGIVLHRGFIPFGGMFLTFSDYSRNAIRLAALMGLRTIYVLVHDSINLGEDGPTHQPIEHLASLRLIPGLDVWRPCDAEESMVAWIAAIERDGGPTCLVYSKKNTPFQLRSTEASDNIVRGGYVLRDPPEAPPQAVIIATGTEVSVAMEAQQLLQKTGIPVRVVSMPSTTAFDRQDLAYRKHVLPPDLPCAAVEAGARDLWYKYVGRSGAVFGIDRFGKSAPASELFKLFGLTPERIAAKVSTMICPRNDFT
jgi:transketolase